MDRVPAIPASGGREIAGFQGRVELVRISFAYASRPKTLVLRELSLLLEPGTVTALVGGSGGGKSTIASLMMRFYDPRQGQVLIDGVPIGEIDLHWLHGQMTIVQQEPVLFSGTVASNVKYGVRGDVTAAEVEDALRAANAWEFVSGFESGVQEVLGERGVSLSGGQRQRIAIARALLTNPKVLLADEATSALDAESEHLVQSALDRLMQGRTVLLIAHRLSTVRSADSILVIDGGTVMEQGRHHELVAQGGKYATLVQHQLS